MMSRFTFAFFVFATVLLAAGCATSPEVAERQLLINARIESILSDAASIEQLGGPQRCLSDFDFRSFRALGDRHLLFDGRGEKMWINTLRSRCPDLRHGRVLRVNSTVSVSRMCNLDTFQVDDWFAWPWYRRWPWSWGSGWSTGMTCTLGKFQPISQAQLDAIEEALELK